MILLPLLVFSCNAKRKVDRSSDTRDEEDDAEGLIAS